MHSELLIGGGLPQFLLNEPIPLFLTLDFAMILSLFFGIATQGILQQYSQGAIPKNRPKGRKIQC